MKIIIAIVGGFVIGSIVNMMLITVGTALVPPPPGVDVTDPESLAAGIHLFGPQHFIVPFVAHAAGTFTAVLIAMLITPRYHLPIAGLLGCLNLAGGIAAATMFPAPVWYIALDLLIAYVPMAYLAYRLGTKIRPPATPAGA